MLLVFWRPQEWLIPVIYGWPLLDFIIFFAFLQRLLAQLDPLDVDQGFQVLAQFAFGTLV